MKLTSPEKKWIQSIFESFAPPSTITEEGELAPAPGEVDYADDFAVLNRHATPVAKLGLRAAVVMIATSPVWTGRGLKSVNGLSREERTELLGELSAHSNAAVRELTWLLKVQTGMALLGVDDIRRRSRYDKERDSGTPIKLRIKKKSESAK